MMTIDFNPDGMATCLHSDDIPLQSIGTLTTRRASEVEFDELNQEWVVYKANKRDAHGVERGSIIPLFRSASRAECLVWERENWERLV